jgi:hypothetical protein
MFSHRFLSRNHREDEKDGANKRRYQGRDACAACGVITKNAEQGQDYS